jgi:hypothetical protein
VTEIPELRTVGAQRGAERALSYGFPITCATCEHLQDSWERNAEDCGKTITCGGPIFGRYFPDYKGPLTQRDLENVCLKCGTSRIDFHVHGGLRRFGLCYPHKDIFDGIDAPGTQQPTVVRVPGRSL